MMSERADFAVVGRGLMGTACARHLAEAGYSVVLIGPDEPKAPRYYSGPFASHHDAARITRHIATDPDWAELAIRSIRRYRDMEVRSGIPFYHPVGGVMAAPGSGPGAEYGRTFSQVARDEGIEHDALSGASLCARFPMFHVADGTVAALDPIGGWIAPRAFRRAEETLAMAAGAKVISETVTDRAGSKLTLGSGHTVAARHVVLAHGPYATLDGLSPVQPQMDVFARTVTFVHLTDKEAEAFSGMPSLIFVPEGQTHGLYVLPPLRYPDGSMRVKIGGEPTSPRLSSPQDAAAWFQSDGDAEVGAMLLAELRKIMPSLPTGTVTTGACAVSFTATGKPCILRVDDDMTLLTGGNGAGAKCADELGRLGALTALGTDIGREGYSCSFGLPEAGAPRTQGVPA